ncbi:glycosyltransferase family 2 protein, partial [Frankia casuarinae]
MNLHGNRESPAGPAAADEGIWCCELEVSAGGVVRSVVPPRDRQRRARVLALLHGEPLGYAAAARTATGIDVDELLGRVWSEFGGRINDHLVGEGLRPLERLDARTRPAAATEACPNKVQSTDLDSTDLVSVVVATRDRSEILANCLRRLTEVTYPAVEFLIVDNAPSSDATKRVVDSFSATDERFRYVPEPRPGLSRARNRGLALARGVYVAYTDDDVSVDPGWIDGLVRGFRRRPDVACVTGLVCTASIVSAAEVYFDARASYWSTRCEPVLFDLADNERHGPLYPYIGFVGTGANVGFDVAFLRDLGGFDEALGAGTRSRGGEDLDLFVRMLRAGRAIAYEPAAFVWHHHRADDAALLAQMFGYGSGFTAFLAKLLLQRSTRGEVVRRIPRGLRGMARIGHATSQRLDGRVQAPKGALLREFAGYAAGPLLYARE